MSPYLFFSKKTFPFRISIVRQRNLHRPDQREGQPEEAGAPAQNGRGRATCRDGAAEAATGGRAETGRGRDGQTNRGARQQTSRGRAGEAEGRDRARGLEAGRGGQEDHGEADDGGDGAAEAAAAARRETKRGKSTLAATGWLSFSILPT